jgi:acetylornithine deacetylase/succinyl-diaminopimelate desuccinylase-like protein
VAQHYRNLLDPKRATEAERFLRANDPRSAALLRTTVTPTMLSGGYRVNVIPSDAKATVDVRLLPGDDPDVTLQMMRKVVNDPAVDIRYLPRDVRPAGTSRLDTEAFKTIEGAISRHYATTTVPLMSSGATDMSYLRARGVQCYGVGPVTDAEDEAKGFGAHSDQERILESEFFRFVRFNWDVVAELAGGR